MIRLAFCLCMLTCPAFAQEVACHYDLECFEGEDCSATDMSLTLRTEPEGNSAMTLITDAETLRGEGIEGNGPISHAIFAADTAVHLFTVTSELASRYTVHMQGPMAITYHGTCEKVE